jgi:chromosome partitioning protein
MVHPILSRAVARFPETGEAKTEGVDHTMKLIAIASQKGGSGKTTLAAHLAVEAEKSGAGPIMLIDGDPQRTLTQWWEDRSAGGTFAPGLLKRAGKDGPERDFNLLADMESMREFGANFVIVDTPPGLSSEIQEAIRHADLVIVPVRPSPHDLRASAATVALARNFDKEVLFVLSGATVRTRICADAILALAQHGPVAPVIIHQRVAFAGAMIDGGTAMELQSSSKASQEIATLWQFVKDRMEGKVELALRQIA